MAYSCDYLNSILTYDPLSGELRNKIDRHRAKAGFLHRSTNSGGCVVIRVWGRLMAAHRVIWCMMTGGWPDEDVDHVDTDRLNNRWDNLREATSSQNGANKAGWGALGYKGVCKIRDRYKAHIRIGPELIHLGYYTTPEEASDAYLEAAIIVHGEFARAA